MKVKALPIAIQTVYADLVERAWTGDLAQLTTGPGTAYNRKAGGHRYWYWQPATEHGRRPSAKYIGPDSEKTHDRVRALSEAATSQRERLDMVRCLRAARLPYPDALTGDVLAAIAEAGVFQQRAVVIGAVAFQSYAGILGVHLPAIISRSDDGVDGARRQSIALAVEEEVGRYLEDILKSVDERFVRIPDTTEYGRILRYELRVDCEEQISVDIYSPLRALSHERVTIPRELRTHAPLLRYHDFLLCQKVNAVALHGAGIPINVPEPTRYAVHKLLLAQMRLAISRSQDRANRDLQMAEALIGVLANQRPGDLQDIWADLRERGSSWRRKADKSLLQLSQETRGLLRAGETTSSR